jgi:hypothetical protein
VEVRVGAGVWVPAQPLYHWEQHGHQRPGACMHACMASALWHRTGQACRLSCAGLPPCRRASPASCVLGDSPPQSTPS